MIDTANRLAQIDALISALTQERAVLVHRLAEETIASGPEEVPPARPETIIPTAVILGVSHIVQGDPRWGQTHIGEVGYTGCLMEDGGCAVAALSALTGYHLGRDVTPVILNRYLQESGGYADGAAVVWATITKLLEKYGVGAQHRSIKSADLAEVGAAVREQIDKENPVVLRMRGSNGPHFLLAIGYTAGTDGAIDIVTHDPGTKRGDGYGQPPCTLENPTRSYALEGAEVYDVTKQPI
ncbi:MAG: hypothetical protein F4Y39_24800 [Gemmatimonadetes bacterium]|nr:hypothetical protein [Gemmatimonadota bacterium]MYF79168.1 hypothetical protein [Chloroflexota bacterium]